MTSPHDDPRITAYALGELDDAERAALEAELGAETLEAAHGELDELAAQLRLAFQAERAEGLSPHQRERLREAAAPRGAVFLRPPVIFGAGLALAASLALLCSPLLLQVQTSPRYVAEAPPPKDAPLPNDPASTGIPRPPQLTTAAVDPSPPPGEVNPGRARLIVEPSARESEEDAVTLRPGAILAADANPAIHDAINIDVVAGLPLDKAPAEQLERDRRLLDANNKRLEGDRRSTDAEPAAPQLPDSQRYDPLPPAPFQEARSAPLSTFSIDVDTASYANVRRYLNHNTPVPPAAVRIEELINAFPYADAPPTGDEAFAAHLDVAPCPWNAAHKLLRIALKGRVIPRDQRPPTNLVFLIDVSGSMGASDKLPLLVEGLQALVDELGEGDRVAIAVYAGASGLVLPSTHCDRKDLIKAALSELQSGGSTNAGEGLQLAYETAVGGFIDGGVNRVILCTDGDFNVGLTSKDEMLTLISDRARTGVFLTVLGFGMHHADAMLELIADKGNGHYALIDSRREAHKVLVEELSGTLVTIAKDVKLQVEFNPREVAQYRLLGYENRQLAHRDFADDTKDAGEIGAGHSVTALYELIPASPETPDAPPALDGVPLKYQGKPQTPDAATSGELLTLQLRHKAPDSDTSTLQTFTLKDPQQLLNDTHPDFQFAAAVAAFGLRLRGQTDGASWDLIEELAQGAIGDDPGGHRKAFLTLVRKARELSPR